MKVDAGLLATGLCVGVCVWELSQYDAVQALRSLQLSVRGAKARVRKVVVSLEDKLGKADAKRGVSLADVSEMVDVIRLGLTAGLSFDAALGLYCEQKTGELSSCMARARLSWQLGLMTREEGLMDVARTVGIRQLETFAVAVSQAHALGAPLADTLARQGKEMRAAHRAEVERQIERAPVKMLIPTGTLILPALLLSIVGPLLAAGGMV